MAFMSIKLNMWTIRLCKNIPHVNSSKSNKIETKCENLEHSHNVCSFYELTALLWVVLHRPEKKKKI